jgi:hypothetical protein
VVSASPSHERGLKFVSPFLKVFYEPFEYFFKLLKFEIKLYIKFNVLYYFVLNAFYLNFDFQSMTVSVELILCALSSDN